MICFLNFFNCYFFPNLSHKVYKINMDFHKKSSQTSRKCQNSIKKQTGMNMNKMYQSGVGRETRWKHLKLHHKSVHSFAYLPHFWDKNHCKSYFKSFLIAQSRSYIEPKCAPICTKGCALNTYFRCTYLILIFFRYALKS